VHQGKLPYLLSLVLGAVASLAVSSSWHCFAPTLESRQLEALNDAVNRKPLFKTFLSGRAVGDGTVMKVPIRSGVAVLQFTVRNTGSAPSPDVIACLSYSAGFTNVLPAGGWERLGPPDSFDHDQVVPQGGLAHYGLDWKSPVAKGNAVPLPPIQIVNPRPMLLRLMVWSGTSERFQTDLSLTVESDVVTITTKTSQGEALSGK
jgi:hypothetical protein